MHNCFGVSRNERTIIQPQNFLFIHLSSLLDGELYEDRNKIFVFFVIVGFKAPMYFA